MVTWSIRESVAFKIRKKTGCTLKKAYLAAGEMLLKVEKDPTKLNMFVSRFPIESLGTRRISPVALFKSDQAKLLLTVNSNHKVFCTNFTTRFSSAKLFEQLPESIKQEYTERYERIKDLNDKLRRIVQKGNTTGLHLFKRTIWNTLPSLPGLDPKERYRGWQDMLYKGKIGNKKWRSLDAKRQDDFRGTAASMRLVRQHTLNELKKVTVRRIKKECKDLVLQPKL